MITIINYGLGNIQAFYYLYQRLNIKINIANNADDVKKATKIILPGVGSFDHAMNMLNASGMRDELDNSVIGKKVPIIGICVGMQILANSSEEGKLPGLGWIDGHVKKFEEKIILQKTHLPHMGWNNVIPKKDEILFKGIENPKYYFLHSYYFIPNKSENIISTTNYYIDFASSVKSENVYGTQFHPEKSHGWGTQLLYNFSII